MALHPLWNDFPALASPLDKVEKHIRGIVDESPSGIKNDLARLLLSNGKMLRPAFVLLSSQWGTRGSENIASVAASVELLHIATLIHDDVIDKASTRRGVPTIHKTLGIKKAVLAGDYLMSVAMKMAAPECETELIPIFLDGITTICLGEIDQDFHGSQLNIGREAYLKRIKGKTAELFGLACMVGAQATGAEKEIRDKLYKLGTLFGMAFQVEDDILDYIGKPGKLGKRTGKDLKEGIPTLPLIHALEEKDPIVSFYDAHPVLRPFIPGVRKRIVNKGYAAKADETAKEFKQQALQLLDELPDIPSAKAFRGLFTLLESRSI